MSFINNVYVNWSDGKLGSFGLLEHFQWKNEDDVQLFSQLPIVAVTPELYDFIENDYGVLPPVLLDEIFQKAVRVKSSVRSFKVDYAAVISDGNRILAFDTNGSVEPKFKSRVPPRHEERVLEALHRLRRSDYDWVPEYPYNDYTSLENKLLRPTSKRSIGLTRTELELKELVMDSLFDLLHSDNISEVEYWFTELFPSTDRDKLSMMEKKQMVEQMYEELEQGWTDKHMNFGSNIVKTCEIKQEMWRDLLRDVVVR